MAVLVLAEHSNDALNDVTAKTVVAAQAFGGDIDVLVASGCPGLVIDLKTYANFAAVPTTIPYLPNGDINTAGFAVTPGGPLAIESLRVFYRWPVMTDFMRSRLSTLPDGKTLLYSTLTWKNEPYPI